MDSGMLMNILIELINSKPLTPIQLPDFRIDQLIKAATKPIGPVNERKTMEPLCALYSLCLYYSLNTTFTKDFIFRVLALFQALQSETLVIISNHGGKKFRMPDLALTFAKNPAIDVNYKLEVFSEALALARLTCRELYALMKVVFRVGKRGAQSVLFSPEEKRKHAKYAECMQPYSIYFMCAFAYSHIATMLHAHQNINIYPGTIETFMVMLVTTTPAECTSVAEHAAPKHVLSAEEIIRAVQAEEAERKAEEEGQEAPKAVVVTLKLSYETFMETAHKLATFVAHIIFDDRSLQEAQICHVRLSRQFNHPDVTFAQFRTSAAKALLSHDDLPCTVTASAVAPSTAPSSAGAKDQRNRKTASTSTTTAAGATSSSSAAATTSSTSAASLPSAGKGAVTQTEATKTNTKVEVTGPVSPHKTVPTASAVIDITAPGYHFLSKVEKPETWQVQDPNEVDYEFPGDASRRSDGKGAPPAGGRLGSAHGQKKDMLPSLPISRAGLMSPKGGRAKTSASNKEGISELPLPSGRMTGRETPGRGRVRSARPKSSRSMSSDGDHSDSDAVSSNNDEATSTKASSSIFGANPYAAPGRGRYLGRQPPADEGTAVISKDQKISGYWVMGKTFRGAFLVFDALQTRPELHCYFEVEYHPPKHPMATDADLLAPPGLSTHPVYEVCKIMEAQYYHVAPAVRLPRILNPTQDVYWICSYLIEYLARKTTQGFGLHPSTVAELNALKKQFKTMKLTAHAPTATASDKAHSPTRSLLTSHSSVGSASSGNLRLPPLAHQPGSASPDPDHRMGKRDKETRYQNIQARLAAAALEAGMEAKVFDMSRRLHKETHPVDESAQTRSRLLSEFSDMEALIPPVTPEKEKEKDTGPPKSIVWTCAPRRDQGRVAAFIGQENEDFNENPFAEPISKQAKQEYAKKILDYKREKAEEEAQYEQYLKDMQENVIAQNRAAKEERIRQLREQTKAELLNKTKFKQEWEVLQRKQQQMERTKARIEAKEREDSALRELLHVKEVKQLHEARLRQEEIQRKEALRLEAAKIQLLASEAEVAIINRQNREEARMKFLEERRRAIEDKVVQAEAAKRAKLVRKQQRAAETRDRIQARVRMGTFKWHNGVYGYYDNVRKEPVEWVQYEDANGVPYYYDPVTKTTQYREPQDANWHHYTDDERREYDAIHGEGAYDAYKADRAWKDGVNRDGGYWNEKGVWVVMDGYFDENYEWVANEGYYDENGKYRKYAKVCGDLSFMV